MTNEQIEHLIANYEVIKRYGNGYTAYYISGYFGASTKDLDIVIWMDTGEACGNWTAYGEFGNLTQDEVDFAIECLRKYGKF